MDGEKFRQEVLGAVWRAENRTLALEEIHHLPEVQRELGSEFANSLYVTEGQVEQVVEQGTLRFTDSTRQAVAITPDGMNRMAEQESVHSLERSNG